MKTFFNYSRSWLLSTLIALFFVHQNANAQLIISEYLEGSSNNKAIEVTNVGATEISLSDFQLVLYTNTAKSSRRPIDFNDIQLAPNEVWVVVNSSSSDELKAKADQESGSLTHNGDEVITLELRDETIIDSLGQWDQDPGSQWEDGSLGTQNQGLRRIYDASFIADTNVNDTVQLAGFWTGTTQDDFSDLGVFAAAGTVTPGTGTPTTPTVLACGEPATLIHEIQGNGEESPKIGESVTIEAIVTKNFLGSTQLNGFFVQQADALVDTNPQTSEGIFVFAEGLLANTVNEGDLVRLTGSVSEFFGLTQITYEKDLEICENDLTVSEVILTFPTSDELELEAFEGMKVKIQDLFISDNSSLGQYGELKLTEKGRLMQPTQIALPGEPAKAVETENEGNSLYIDDGSTESNPVSIPYLGGDFTASLSVRIGDKVLEASGVLAYGFGFYRIHADQPITLETSNPRPTNHSKKSEDSIVIASFNVLNLFNGEEEDKPFPTSRGATTFEEYDRQLSKIVAAFHQIDADVIGIMEIENDGYGPSSTIQDLVTALNMNGTTSDYAFVNPGMDELGGDAIAVGLIYKPGKVELTGKTTTILDVPFDFSNRPPLIQSFKDKATGRIFTVAVNHFKAKGSCRSAEGLDQDQDDGQACWNAIRVEAANTLYEYLETDPTEVGHKDYLIIGDLNAYRMEDPITSLESKGLVYLNDKFLAEGENSYSYMFNGLAGSLDHALASESLSTQVIAATEWHINADEPIIFDYNMDTTNDRLDYEWFNNDAYRASDHDPVIIELALNPVSEEPQPDPAPEEEPVPEEEEPKPEENPETEDETVTGEESSSNQQPEIIVVEKTGGSSGFLWLSLMALLMLIRRYKLV